MNQFIKDCLSNIAKNSEAISAASQGINTAVIAILGYTAGQQDAQDFGGIFNAAESLNSFTQVENGSQNIVSVKPLIEGIKKKKI